MRSKTKQIMDYARMILDGTGKPMHSREIYAILVETELYDGTRQALYNLLYNQIRDAKCEEDKMFWFFGKGVFSSRSVLLSSLDIKYQVVEPKERPPHGINYNRAGDLPGDKQRRIEYVQTAQANQTCGNCKYIQYRGIQADIKQAGGCGKYSETKRATVINTTPACELWKLASLNKARNNKRKVTI